MKAVRLLEYGGQLVFNDVPAPTIARDEILVKIKSTAVNHLDLVEASGTARQRQSAVLSPRNQVRQLRKENAYSIQLVSKK